MLPARADLFTRPGLTYLVKVGVFEADRKPLADASIETQNAEITKTPGTTIKVDAKVGEKVLRPAEAFEDHDDVQQVYSNFDIPEELLAKLGA